MELHGDKYHSGKALLTRFAPATRYPWDYWVGLSLWTGEWLYFRNGVDFSTGARAFRAAAHAASGSRNVLYKASWKDMPKDEIKVVWLPKEQTFAERAANTQIPADQLDISQIPDMFLNDPEFREAAGLDK
jgi:hypothetical protein